MIDQAVRDANREVAAARLAGYLRSGQLSLYLGAGVSQGMGLPSWQDLVERCERAAGVTPDGSADLMRRMDTVRRRVEGLSKFKTLVRDNLYADLAATNSYPDELLINRMLIALGALVMSSVRGSVTDVFTLNFDDVLDWYLHLHGFKTQVVTELPELISAQTDVRILHVHGFVPLTTEFTASEWLILTHDQLVERLTDHAKPWPIAISSMLQSKIMLAVGTSMNDIDMDVLVKRAHAFVGGARPVGFVLCKGLTEDRAEALAEWGIECVAFDEFEEIPEFLLGVCRRAAGDSSHGKRVSV